METYEKLGAFYLGKTHDLAAGKTQDDLLLYDAKDLTTHAVCVGMTGSGKTGLCVSLLEEAAIDGIPAIAIDPKGDLGNLLLTFPKLRGEDFLPWVDAGDAARKGLSPADYAADRATLWRRGLADWGQDGARIERFRNAVDLSIYTPGSTAGLPITVLRSFAAPPAAIVADGEAFRERIAGAVSGLLALVGVDADPVRSREHILLSRILDRAWRAGRDLDVAGLIGEIQNPPFARVGVMDIESFYPSKDRFGLAMLLNNLLAAPSFAAWMEGEPLDVGRLLYTPEGKPRVSILSIAHLSDPERMFFVTILLNEVVAWMRTQAGTGSLRALLYMDEIFGFFPPTANPPSKPPMLTLLKQARAYGLGVVLATQNPVDLDYKGLSNTGTWFLGRLQTERDKQRVIEGLEGASAAAGGRFNRAKMEATLAGLGSRVFLMNNVHEDQPVLFHTRWAMSYLRGPLTREQIRELMAPRKAAAAAAGSTATAAPAAPAVMPAAASGPTGAASASVAPASIPPPGAAAPPPLPPGVTQHYLAPVTPIAAGETLLYRPSLIGAARAHYVRVSAKVDDWVDMALLTSLEEVASTDPWRDATPLARVDPPLEVRPGATGRFAPLPAAATNPKSYPRWSKALVDHLYRNRSITILKSARLKQYSRIGESEGDFRVRLRQTLHERRDEQVEKLRKRYAPKLQTLQDRLRRAEERVDRESSQYKQAGFQTAVSLGATVLGALFGRKKASAGTVGRAATTLRGAGRTASQRGDIGRAAENVDAVRARLAELERSFEDDVESVHESAEVEDLVFEELTISPRKGDMAVEHVAVVWLPYRTTPAGFAEPAFATSLFGET